MKNFVSLAFVLSVCFVAPSLAQTEADSAKSKNAARQSLYSIANIFEFGSFNSEGLNTLLSENGYPTLNGSYYFWAIGISHMSDFWGTGMGNWIATVGCGYLQQSQSINAKHSTQMNGWAIFQDLGYAIINSQHFRLYPALGMRWHHLTLAINENTSLNALLSSPNYSGIEITLRNLTFVPEIGADYRFKFTSEAENYAQVGFLCGYSFGTQSFVTLGATNLGNRNVSPKGFFWRIMLAWEFSQSK